MQGADHVVKNMLTNLVKILRLGMLKPKRELEERLLITTNVDTVTMK